MRTSKDKKRPSPHSAGRGVRTHLKVKTLLGFAISRQQRC